MCQYSADALLDLAAVKDTGFTAPTFVDALTAINRLTDADWAEDGIDAENVPELQETFWDWRERLAGDG